MQNDAFYSMKQYFNINRYAKPSRSISILKLHFSHYIMTQFGPSFVKMYLNLANSGLVWLVVMTDLPESQSREQLISLIFLVI